MTKPSSYSLAVVIHFGVALVLDTLCAETVHFSAVTIFIRLPSGTSQFSILVQNRAPFLRHKQQAGATIARPIPVAVKSARVRAVGIMPKVHNMCVNS